VGAEDRVEVVEEGSQLAPFAEVQGEVGGRLVVEALDVSDQLALPESKAGEGARARGDAPTVEGEVEPLALGGSLGPPAMKLGPHRLEALHQGVAIGAAEGVGDVDADPFPLLDDLFGEADQLGARSGRAPR
jgi:hypothetical protein